MPAVRWPVSFTLNGAPVDLDVEPQETLVETLRQRLALTGTKEGCSQGECGACTVLMDGKPHNACLLFTVDVRGKAVTTIEGVADAGDLHPLQKAFVQAGAIQCGFCTPGMVLSALALLEHDLRPDRKAVQDALAGNICRCTGYNAILDAVLAAVAAQSQPGAARASGEEGTRS